MVLGVDMSRSGWFGSGGRNKVEVAAELCGVLAFAAIANKDKVGLVLFSDRVEKYIPPAKGKSHVLRLIRELLTFEPEGRGTDLNEPLRLLGSVLKRKATVFLVSRLLGRRLHPQPGAPWAGATTWWRCGCAIPARPTCRRWAWCAGWMPRAVASCWWTPRRPRPAGRCATGRGVHDEQLERDLAAHGVDLVDVDATAALRRAPAAVLPGPRGPARTAGGGDEGPRPPLLGAALALLLAAPGLRAQDDRGGPPVTMPPLPGLTGAGARPAQPAPVPPDTVTAPVDLSAPARRRGV